MALTPPNNSPGAGLWEAAMQGGTNFQPGIPRIVGGPQSVIYASVGSICVDETGKLWVKTTDKTVATGWKYATLN